MLSYGYNALVRLHQGNKTLMTVQPEDRTLYGQFANDIARKIGFMDEFPSVVWHYTSAAGMLGILESGSIFATQLACLNDQTELRYAMGYVRAALREMRPLWQNDPNAVFILDLLEKTREVDLVPESSLFVACFSRHADDLSQWRAYGGGENGYALGFQTQSLISARSRRSEGELRSQATPRSLK